MDPKPTIGRIVIFRGPGIGAADEAPAIITAVHKRGFVSMTVFPPHSNPFPANDVPLDADGAGGTCWHWPERV
jgi:hypothetical protein